MMKKYLLKISGLAAMALLLHISGFAQDDNSQDNDNDKPKNYDEIIIRPKGDKSAKVTVEIRNGEILVDGKPLSEFDDSSLSIRKQHVRVYRNNHSYITEPSDDAFKISPEIIAGDVGRNITALAPYGSRDGVWSYGNGDFSAPFNRAFLGVTGGKSENGQGCRVMQVSKGSAAEKIGLRPGDVITKVDETTITDPQSLISTIREYHPGDKISLTYSRDGKEQKVSVQLGKMKDVGSYNFQFNMPDMPNMPDMKNLELPQGNWPREFKEYFGNSLKFGIRAQDAEDGKGVKVLDVDDESAAAKAGIKEGDIITRFDGKEINSVATLTEAAQAAKEKVSVKVTIIRDGQPKELEVKVPKRLHTADL